MCAIGFALGRKLVAAAAPVGLIETPPLDQPSPDVVHDIVTLAAPLSVEQPTSISLPMFCTFHRCVAVPDTVSVPWKSVVAPQITTSFVADDTLIDGDPLVFEPVVAASNGVV